MSNKPDTFHDECGVFGIFSTNPIDIPSLMYYGLFALQHRGQEGCGIAVSNTETISFQKGLGTVADVFTQDKLDLLRSIDPVIGVGHVRYPTAGCNSINNVQPLIGCNKKGTLATAHNGNLTNANKLRKQLEKTGVKFKSSSDTEVISNCIISSLKSTNIESSVSVVADYFEGAFSLIIMTNKELIGIRDQHAIRPLCIGQLHNGGYVLSSESCALDTIGAKFIRDLHKGEMVVINKDGLRSNIYGGNQHKQSCIFEYAYFARPDSVIDGISVYESRIKQGELLASEHKLKADLVIGTPDSGIPAAIGYAKASGIPYGIGLVKSHYVNRTFIKPTQELREKNVYIKLRPLKSAIKNKEIILIDDSIVRGTTSKHIVRALKHAGAKKVYMLSAVPPIKYPCFLGVDTPNRKELIAANLSIEKMKKYIGCDYLGFLSLKNLINSVGGKNEFCTGCFNNVYPVKPHK